MGNDAHVGEFAISFSAHPAGLRAHLTGSGATFATALAYWTAIVQAVRDRRPEGLLLVDELEGHRLAPEDWKLLVHVFQDQGLAGIRIAHVKTNGLENLEYCEIYAREAGLDARAFLDETAASIWLRYGER